MKRDKRRDMIRSLLPSCSGRHAKWSGRAINRKARSAIRRELKLYDTEEADDSDLRMKVEGIARFRRIEHNRRVMDRRGSDKIGPFLRWARSKTKALETNEEKYFAIQALLAPSNVITQHAMSHWEGDCPLNPHRFSRWYYGWSSHDPVYITRELFEKAFREAFETCHKTVNKILKSGGGWSYGKFSTHHRYKDCKAGEDFCVEQWIWRRRVYKYKLPTVGYWSGETTGPKTYRITESDRPTMSYGVKKMLPFDSYIKETPKERHRLSWCQARVLLKHPEDVKKVTDYLFSTYYRFRADGTGVGKRKKSNVFRERDLRNNRGKTVKELVELFKRKGFIE